MCKEQCKDTWQRKKANSEPNDWCVQNTVNARGDKGTKKWVVQNRSFTLGHRAWPHALQNNTNTKMGAQFTSTGVGTWPQVTSTRVGTYNFLIKYVSRDRKCVSRIIRWPLHAFPRRPLTSNIAPTGSISELSVNSESFKLYGRHLLVSGGQTVDCEKK